MTDSDDGLGRDGGDADHRGHGGNGTYGDREGREMPAGRTEPDKGEGRDGEGRDRERRDGGGPDDGRRVMSGALLSSDAPTLDGPVPSVDSLLGAAVRGGTSADGAGEARAVAAFLAAREKGARTARTRRRDDWRPNARRRVQLSIRTTLAVLLASLTFGGVAFAAIGSATRDDEGTGRDPGDGGQDRRPRTTDSAPALPGPATADRPDRDEETVASQHRDKADRQGDGNGTDDDLHGGRHNGKDNGRHNGRHNGDGNGSGSGRGESPRPAEPNAPRPGESPKPNEPSRPTGAGGRNPADVERNPGGEERTRKTKSGTREAK